MPCVVAFVVVPDLIMRALFMRGAFTAADALAAGHTLAAYAVGLLPFVLIRSAVATFFARGDTATPVKAALIAVAVNIAFKVLLMGPLAQVGLALATSIGAWINLVAGAVVGGTAPVMRAWTRACAVRWSSWPAPGWRSRPCCGWPTRRWRDCSSGWGAARSRDPGAAGRLGGVVYGGIVLALFGGHGSQRFGRACADAENRLNLCGPCGNHASPLPSLTAPDLVRRITPPLAAAARAMVVLALAGLLAGCGERQQQSRGAPPPPTVTVAKPVKRTVIDFDEYVGRFVAVNSVEIRARVSGYLDAVHFKDGQIVKQGDLLFTIDKRPFQNTLDQAKRQPGRWRKSNLIFTKSDLARGQQLVRDKTITEQMFEQRSQAYRNAQAAVAANEAAVRQAELDLQFTELRAPINGRIGDRRVSPGNLVTGGTGGNTTLLATIVSIDPIHFEFTFDEASFLRYERMSKTGGDVASRGAGVPVEAQADRRARHSPTKAAWISSTT